MSLTGALGAAKSGLGTTAVQAEIVARNISNANTPGFTRKSADLVTVPGGGVYVAGIDRQVDKMLNRLDRDNTSKLAAETTVAEGMKIYTDLLGQPTDEMSPAAKMAEMKNSFITLSLNVSDKSAQLAVVSAAREMVSNLSQLSGTLASVSSEVEMNIKYEVSELNTALNGISALNRKILAEPAGTARMGDYQDQMDQYLQQVSGIVDIQTSSDRNGMVTVTTGGGVELVSERFVNDVAYNPVTGQITAGDVNMTPDGTNRSFSGGRLAGLFSLRNDTLPSWRNDLDTMAASLVEGFERVAPLADGKGLFTDRGDAFDPASIAGLAGRLEINRAVDHEAGGNPALLQSAGDPARPSGDTSVVDAMLRVFESPVNLPGREFGDATGLTDLATTIVGAHQQIRARAESSVRSTSTAAETVSASRQNLQGVSVDDELQNLLLIQRSSEANARVLTTVASMMDVILDATR